MSENFKIEIISPEKKILTQEITSVTLPAFEGDITILYNHIPLITFLRPGIIIINDDEKLQYFVEDGTVEFSNNSLSLLTSTIHELKKLSKEQIDKLSFLNSTIPSSTKKFFSLDLEKILIIPGFKNDIIGI